MTKPILHPGEIVVLSVGEYSNYEVAGVFIVAKKFNWEKTKELYCEERRPGEGWVSTYDWPGWLVRKGLVVELDTDEWHFDYD